MGIDKSGNHIPESAEEARALMKAGLPVRMPIEAAFRQLRESLIAESEPVISRRIAHARAREDKGNLVGIDAIPSPGP
jgi:hypothetical protein